MKKEIAMIFTTILEALAVVVPDKGLERRREICTNKQYASRRN